MMSKIYNTKKNTITVSVNIILLPLVAMVVVVVVTLACSVELEVSGIKSKYIAIYLIVYILQLNCTEGGNFIYYQYKYT